MDDRLKPNGRTFKVIKYKVLGYEEHIKHDALDKVGDTYKERKDGWFKNMRNDTGTNILKIEGWEEYYEEVLK